MDDAPDVLLIGYGNPARGDDGLGPALAEAVASRDLDGITVEWPYHLQVEDAATVASHDLVIFADANASAGAAPFTFRAIEPGGRPSWTTHALAPAAVLALARDVFGATPPAYLLALGGEQFEAFSEGLSPAARDHLAVALAWLVPRLEERDRDLLVSPAPVTIEG